MAAFYTFEDLSGSVPEDKRSDNPFQDLIESCNHDPAEIQKRYDTHRTKRNALQKEKMKAFDFGGIKIDEILAKLESSQQNEDPRHCLVFWARPTTTVKAVIADIQKALQTVAPNIWLMPQASLHMTALEVVHSRTNAEIEALVDQLRPHAQTITDWTNSHRCRLIKPLVSFDAQALALSWLPAACEVSQGRTLFPDDYTYHHLRTDLCGLASQAGVTVASRYVIPSAHLTIARFINTSEFECTDGSVNRDMVAKLVEEIERINGWLKERYWPKDGEDVHQGGEWIVGEEQGLDFRKGTLWYGGGETVRLGRGF